MDALMKSLGVIILLIGVGLLVFVAFTGLRSNVMLGTGLIAVIIGFFAHIVLNKKFE